MKLLSTKRLKGGPVNVKIISNSLKYWWIVQGAVMKLKKDIGFNRDLFILKLNNDNVKRLLAIVLVMVVITSIQIVLYAVSSVEGYDFDLILTKVWLLLGGIVIIAMLKLIKMSSKVFIKYSQMIISFISFLIIMLAINNSFEAQRITSDISTYIIGLFIVVAAVRMKPINYVDCSNSHL